MHIREIKTKLTAFEIYTLFKEEAYSFILDSAMDGAKLGRYSFIGWEPFLIFKSKNDQVTVIEKGEATTFTGDPFLELKKQMKRYKVQNTSSLPFIGGAVGYLGYDLCHHIEKLPRTAVDDVDIPDCFFGFYDGIIIYDHLKGAVYGAALGITEEAEKKVQSLINKIEGIEAVPIDLGADRDDTVEFKSNFEKSKYLETVDKVREYIKAGDIYQANLTQRFECPMPRAPYELYGRLRKNNPAPFAAFIDFGEGHILSSSPERFIQIKDRQLETRPIKGTRPRGRTPEEDRANREELLGSEKDKAELLMIVDLERNDLGKVSKPGTVQVTELFHLEEYATVYHLVSTVIGNIREEYDEIDCIKAAFPGGSITGAPKIRAMEIIDELEPTQRNIYTGSIGYLGFDGTVDLNIAIRTIVAKEGRAFFQAGGGIVWDSDPQSEYDETLHKARALMKTLRE